MRSIDFTLALGSVMLLAVASPSTAGVKTGANHAPPDDAASAKATADADAVQQRNCQ